MFSFFRSLSLVFGVEETDLVTFPLFHATLNTHEALRERAWGPIWVSPSTGNVDLDGRCVLSLQRLTRYWEGLVLILNVG